MDRFLIHGPCELSGDVTVAGAKNAVLPLMAATLLARARAASATCRSCATHGPWRACSRPWARRAPSMARVMTVDATSADRGRGALRSGQDHARLDLRARARCSARHGGARVSLPGGCAWGPRPVDLHLKGMEALGAKIELESGYIVARGPDGSARRQTIISRSRSVGATANILHGRRAAPRAPRVLRERRARAGGAQLAEVLDARGRPHRGRGDHATGDRRGRGARRRCDVRGHPRPHRGGHLPRRRRASPRGDDHRAAAARPTISQATLERARASGLRRRTSARTGSQSTGATAHQRARASVTRSLSRVSRPTCRRRSWRVACRRPTASA